MANQNILTKIKIGLDGSEYSVVDQQLRVELSGKADALPVGICKNIRCIQQGTIAKIKWNDPDDLIIDGVTLARWEQTILVRKEDSFPENPTDGLVVCQTGLRNKYAINAFVDTVPNQNITYYYKLFSKSSAGIFNNLTENQFESTRLNWNTIHEIVSAGLASSYFNLGDQLTTHHTVYRRHSLANCGF